MYEDSIRDGAVTRDRRIYAAQRHRGTFEIVGISIFLASRRETADAVFTRIVDRTKETFGGIKRRRSSRESGKRGRTVLCSRLLRDANSARITLGPAPRLSRKRAGNVIISMRYTHREEIAKAQRFISNKVHVT